MIDTSGANKTDFAARVNDSPGKISFKTIGGTNEVFVEATH